LDGERERLAVKGGGGKPKQVVLAAAAALASLAVGALSGPMDWIARNAEPTFAPPKARRLRGFRSGGKRRPARYKGSAWARRATARGGNHAKQRGNRHASAD
jgi:hypothetical protein